MRLEPSHLEVDYDGTRHEERLDLPAGSGSITLGPLEVSFEGGPLPSLSALATKPSTWGRWRLSNRGDRPLSVRSVSLVFRIGGLASGQDLRMLRHGYQSWSPTDVAALGRDADPSLTKGSLEWIRAAAHADPGVAREGELRSEWVTVLSAPRSDRRGAPGSSLLVGFDGGSRHDGTLRLRPAPAPPQDQHGSPELCCQAFLGGARLEPGTTTQLHDLLVDEEVEDVSTALEAWATEVGRRATARVGGDYQVGWCSWYHYFHDVTEADLRHNLARAAKKGWPFELFQLDDGYQRAIGDWLETAESFPSGLDELAAAISSEGRRPGIWIAPFLVAPDSQVGTEHPDWLARLDGGEPVPGGFNPKWGGGRGGLMWTLDTTHPEVASHLEHVASSLRAAGFSYLKLDFTYAASFEGRWHDPTLTPAERVRAGFEAVRRGAGEDAFLLGCGVPLSNVVGVVDGNRIGADVAPSWPCERDNPVVAGYEQMLPATRHAAANTFARSFMHRTLWLNDPDCVMLRHQATSMDPAQVETWSRTVAQSGGMALVSDDLGLLGTEERRRFAALVEAGRRSDAEAREGRPPRCVDLMEAPQPSRLAADGRELAVDAASGASSLRGG